MHLTHKHCIPCRGGIPPLTPRQIAPFLQQLKLNWQLKNNQKISRLFTFNNFKKAIDFINKVAKIAEKEGHHPDIHLTSWNKVKIVLFTHKIEGLHENDFIVASKIETLLND